MRATLLILVLLLPSTEAWAPPIPLFDFSADGETVRSGVDGKTCGILVKFYSVHGVDSQCLQEKR